MPVMLAMLAMLVMLLALGAAQAQMTAGPTVGLIDTGVRASHVDLRGIVQSGYNAIDGSTDTRDLVGHGTHVAGIAVEGNPFARVYTATMLWEHRSEPVKPTEEMTRRTAAAYKQIVQSFKDQKLRVVNMSWRYGASAYEGMLAWHNAGATPDERKQLARRLFAIERDLTGLPAEERHAQRKERSAVPLAELEAWMRETRAKLSRHADVARAMDYMLTRWESFARFLGDGRIDLSNNTAERALRGLTFLFFEQT